jgi:hypothetical protein
VFLKFVLQKESSSITVCSPGQHKKKNPIVIMSAMHVSFSVFKAWQACTASSMSSTGSGSMQVGGGSSFS